MYEDMFEMPSVQSSIIKVIGVGGGGGNAVNYMYKQGIKDVNFVVCNTDAQALASSPVPIRVQLGETLTAGRGAGNRPEKGRQSAIESLEEINTILSDNTKMVFITAGMGGGTGTGAAPIIAKAARDLGILTVGIVTIPFRFEGFTRINQAIEGIAEMEKYVDSLLIINNERLREMYGDLGLSVAFSKADDVLAIAAKGIAEIITVHGRVNVDFADVETVMRNSGVAVMGSSSSEGEHRAIDAIEAALTSPLLNNNKIMGATNVLLNITSGEKEITMDELRSITDYVQSMVGDSASIIWGSVFDETMGEKVNVTIVATGFGTDTFVQNMTEKQQKVTRVMLNEDGESMGEPMEITLSDGDEQERVVDFGKLERDKKQLIEQMYRPITAKPAVEDRNADDYSQLTSRVGRYQPHQTVVGDIYEDERLLEQIENIPAYKRRQSQQIPSNPAPSVEPKNVSRFSISSKGRNNGPVIGDNPFLHDNVD